MCRPFILVKKKKKNTFITPPAVFTPWLGYFNEFFIIFIFFFPVTTQTGERGYLEGLASRYADLYNTHYRDILEHLDELRTAEWAELSPRIALLTPASPSRRSPCSNTAGGNSYSHHLYAPGKYSVSTYLVLDTKNSSPFSTITFLSSVFSSFTKTYKLSLKYY